MGCSLGLLAEGFLILLPHRIANEPARPATAARCVIGNGRALTGTFTPIQAQKVVAVSSATACVGRSDVMP
eukprot:scaffold658137_cov57-Prasinocladus_malaysianus.AAC.1